MPLLHIFQTTATMGPDSRAKWIPGDKHAIMVFLRASKGEDYNTSEVIRVLENAGWIDVSISRAGTIETDPIGHPDEVLRGAMLDAAESGEGVVVYSTPIA